jgi:tetratricopeptide (TPR) repeat protein
VLAIRRKLGDRGPEGTALSNVGALYYLEGEMQKALDCYLEAIQLRKAGGDRKGAASTLSKVGLVYSALNRPEQALQSFEGALQGIRESGDKFEEADALSHIGGVYRQLGQLPKALSFYQLSLKLQQDSGRQPGYANDLSNIAMVYRDQGQYDKALEKLQEAYRIDESIHEQRDAGITIERIGAIQRLRGNSAEATDYLDKALLIARQLGEKQLEGATLYERGMAHATRNDWSAALDDAETAIRVTESIRGGVASYEMRASYLAPLRGQYELAIDALMHSGDAARAIATAERSKARSLLDLLTESRSGIGSEIRVDSALPENAHSLEASLGVLGTRLLRMQAGTPQRVAAEAKLQTASADLDAVRAEIRAKSPSYAAITQPEPVSLREIQGLLDRDTIFLEFSLGEPRSYLWLVTPASIESFELASRKTIQAAARKLHDDWSGNAPAAGAELAGLLLRQVSAKLEHARLVIAAEGALEYIPLAALPVSQGSLLIDTHEVVNVPSASALAILRRDAATRTRAPKAIAVSPTPCSPLRIFAFVLRSLWRSRDLRMSPVPGHSTVFPAPAGKRSRS